MSDAAAWQQENTQALSAAVARIRDLLQRHAGGDTAPEVPAEPVGSADRQGWFRRRRPQSYFEAGAAGTRLITAGSDPRTTEQPHSDTVLPPPALATLRDRLGLTPFEMNILLLCVAMELDTSVAALCARAQRDPDRAYPTFALALSIFDEPAWEALSPEGPIRYWQLAEISQPTGTPLTVSRIRADEWVVNYLKGLSYLDDRLTPLVMPLAVAEPDLELPPSQARMAEQILARLTRTAPGQSPPPVQLLGPDPASKRLVAGAVCRALLAHPYRIHAGALPSAPADLETFARLWQRAGRLLPLALYVETDGLDQAGQRGASASAMSRFLGHANALVFVDTVEPWHGLPDGSLSIDVAKPTPAEQKTAWAAALGAEAGDSPARLAGQFSLNLNVIREIAAESRDPAASGAVDHDRLWNAALVRTRPTLEAMAERIVPKASWDDIVLPAPETALLHQIADQVAQRNRVYQDWGFAEKMSRGFGISALFAGESGTGKTMAAEVVANHLRLDLYRIDLSAVVSKYIGETEKNLRRLFDAAEAGGMILFFDEADALFGKRSEVKDSHDRYANIEVNYLLQRMESFGGLAILASNMKSALDGAFMRRLRFIVTFPFPAAAERRAIWQRAFPAATPTSGLDFDRLARLDLAGGHIASIALNAAFVAAQTNGEVTMPIVLDAARNELRKIERPIHEPDFRWPPPPARVA
ncbi:ATP-binding protein [Mycobacterium sp. KBS0706]|uniref:ATP-binding protein n=1 Tax=Mycobacterium sp. KBS0706 TaxID=2578109 RepID=UPI00110FD926|nr:ATP-binding protein [Mycobacterium sp. KBS0706]TSD83955.1 ATP-binding protein [Mycobacterium sp. KBS0706]